MTMNFVAIAPCHPKKGGGTVRSRPFHIELLILSDYLIATPAALYFTPFFTITI